LKLLARKPPKLVALALANKIARTAWAMMTSGEDHLTFSSIRTSKNLLLAAAKLRALRFIRLAVGAIQRKQPQIAVA
jgi:hypothetical protein